MEKEKQNTNAFNIKGEIIHISDAESGRKGYYCMGCNREMQAKKGKILLTHFFAHDPKDVINKGKCTYSDETYRHKLAKEILQRIKQIKVPTLYKYPPLGTDGNPRKIRDSWFVSAHTVRNELTFYENENGVISYGRDINFEQGSNKYHIITPDVTFFDESENPILFIEIVATHKPDEEKLIKIKSLGIDTVQVTIPKDSPKEIEDTFFNTSRTKWLYNYERENTLYLPVSKGDDEAILCLDEFERKLLEATESYECRTAEIKNLIRGFNKCLESEQFRGFTAHIRAEQQRVKNNTERDGLRLRELQEKHKGTITEEFRLEEELFAKEDAGFREREQQFTSENREYETKYAEYERKIQKEEREYRPYCQDEIDKIENDFEQLGTSSTSFEDRIEEIRAETKRLERDYQYKRERIEDDKSSEAESLRSIEQRGANLPSQYLGIEQKIRGEFERKTNELEKKASDIEREFIENRTRIGGEFENLRRESIETIENRDSQRISRLRGHLRNIFETRNKLQNIRQGKTNLNRMRKYKELYDSGAYKNWT